MNRLGLGNPSRLTHRFKIDRVTASKVGGTDWNKKILKEMV